jgi:hypothetical protein
MSSTDMDVLLEVNWGLDVWERRADAIVVAASEAQLSELERRRLARVERLYTVEEYRMRAQRAARPPESDGD